MPRQGRKQSSTGIFHVSKPSDDQVWHFIKEQTGATSSAAFLQLADETKRKILRHLKDSGASHRQLERLTGVGRGLIQKL